MWIILGIFLGLAGGGDALSGVEAFRAQLRGESAKVVKVDVQKTVTLELLGTQKEYSGHLQLQAGQALLFELAQTDSDLKERVFFDGQKLIQLSDRGGDQRPEALIVEHQDNEALRADPLYQFLYSDRPIKKIFDIEDQSGGRVSFASQGKNMEVGVTEDEGLALKISEPGISTTLYRLSKPQVLKGKKSIQFQLPADAQVTTRKSNE